MALGLLYNYKPHMFIHNIFSFGMRLQAHYKSEKNIQIKTVHIFTEIKRPKGFSIYFQFESIHNVLVKSFRFILIPTSMLWVYGHNIYITLPVRGSVPALKGLKLVSVAGVCKTCLKKEYLFSFSVI